MIKHHDNCPNLFRDENMLEQDKDTKYVSPPVRSEFDNKHQRTLVKYKEGEWLVEGQVRVDGKWYVARRTTLYNPPEGKKQYTRTKRGIRRNLGMFTGLSLPMRLLLAPFYSLAFAYYCISGEDVNVQLLESR